MDRAVRGDFPDERDIKGRQGRDAENRDAFRNGCAVTLDCIDQLQPERRLMLAGSRLLQFAPEDVLPILPLACIPS